MATSLDRQLDRLEKADAAARKVHSIFFELGESREQALARYEAANGPIAEGDVVVLLTTGIPDEASAAAVKPRVVAVQRKRAKRPAPAKPKPERVWGGTTCQGAGVYPDEQADGKRDPYDWRALDKKPLRYPDIYPSPDAGAADERALRGYALKLSRRSSL